MESRSIARLAKAGKSHTRWESAMKRSDDRLRLFLGAAVICGVLVVPVALAGSDSSDRSSKATVSAGVKKKLNSLQRQIDALKAQAGKPGPQGAQGIPGPGATSFDRQFAKDGAFHAVTTVNGLVLSAACDILGTGAVIGISSLAHGWGTSSADGGAPESESVNGDNSITVGGTNVVQLDVVAVSTAPAEPGKWTHIDANVIKGNACNFHGMVIPSSSVG
jgi:hypothetical protein